jgi:ribosome-associated protein
MNSLPMREEHITLAQAIKLAGLAGSGGQAKNLVRSGVVLVNDAAEIQPGRKLGAGDRFRVLDGEEWILVR